MAAGPSQESLIQALCAVVANATGLGSSKVRLYGGPRPKLPYAQVHQLTPGVAQHREEREDDGDGLLTIRFHRRAVYQVDVWAPGPNHKDFVAGNGQHPADYLFKLDAARFQAAHKATLASVGGAIVAMTEPEDVTRLVDTEHEYRALSRLTVAYRWQSDPVDEGTIERVVGPLDVGGVDTTIDVIQED